MNIVEYIRKLKKQKKQYIKWKCFVTVLSLAIAVSTVSALMLPAITAENDAITIGGQAPLILDTAADSYGAEESENGSANESANGKEIFSQPDTEAEIAEEEPKVEPDTEAETAVEEEPKVKPDAEAETTVEEEPKVEPDTEETETEAEEVLDGDMMLPEESAELQEEEELPLPQKTGSLKEDFAAAAKSQVGYHEVIDGSDNRWTRYGAWYGNPTGDWNGMFVSFCLAYAGALEDAFPFSLNYSDWIRYLIESDSFYSAEDYSPERGDIAFFDKDTDNVVDHVGIVTDRTSDTMEIIEGDVNGAVEASGYKVGDHSILGYGVLLDVTEAPTEPEKPLTTENQTLYQGYREEFDFNGKKKEGLRIVDKQKEDEPDKIAYCYDHGSYLPEIKDPPSGKDDDKVYYTRIESYLEETDEFADRYGPDVKQKAAMALYAGYPYDAYGHRTKVGGMTDNERRVVTQQLLWDITDGRLAPYDYSSRPKDWTYYMVQYYNAIYEDCLKDLKPGMEFQQGWLEVEGNFTFHHPGGQYYSTDEIKTKGPKGKIRFTNLSEGLSICDWNDGRDITSEEIDVGRSFYVKSSNPLNTNQSFSIEYKYNQVKFYFYKYAKGGNRLILNGDGRGIQNLLRVEPTENILIKNFEVTLDGKKEEKCSVKVHKTWVGDIGDSIKLYLYADGEYKDEVTLTKDTGWDHTFEGLPKYRKNGQKISYTIDEEPISGYDKKITQIADGHFEVVNTQASYTLPETGGSGTLFFTIGGAGLLWYACFCGFICEKRKRRGKYINNKK